MGYSTEFIGEITITPPLSTQEVDYLKKFNQTRHTQLKPNPYAIGNFEPKDLINADHDIKMKNSFPPEGQPELWCDWIPTDDGTTLKWSGVEKSYEMEKWLNYLIEHFIGHNPLAATEFPFLAGHSLNGEIEAFGERHKDLWKIVVENSYVTILQGNIVYEKLNDKENLPQSNTEYDYKIIETSDEFAKMLHSLQDGGELRFAVEWELNNSGKIDRSSLEESFTCWFGAKVVEYFDAACLLVGQIGGEKWLSYNVTYPMLPDSVVKIARAIFDELEVSSVCVAIKK